MSTFFFCRQNDPAIAQETDQFPIRERVIHDSSPPHGKERPPQREKNQMPREKKKRTREEKRERERELKEKKKSAAFLDCPY